MEKMQTGRRIITTLPVHGHQNRLIYALTMLLIAKIIIFRLLGIRQGGKADVSPKSLPIAFSIPFTAVSALPMGINSINNYDSAVALSATEITVRYYAHYFIAFGI